MRKTLNYDFGYTFVHFFIAFAVFCAFPILEAHSSTLSYSYDELGRLIQEIYEDGTTITYTYDEVGNRLSKEVLVGGGTGITVTSPDGGETWGAGTSKTIHWTYSGNPGSAVKIELIKGGLLNSVITPATPIGNAVTGAYTWMIATDQIPGNDYQIKVTSTSNTVYSDTSNDNFAIGPVANITVTSPNAGEQWPAGTTKTLRWTYSGNVGPSVRIELLKGGVLDRLITDGVSLGTGGVGTYNWQIPFEQTVGNDYKIKVTSMSNGALINTSSNNFDIIPAGSISLASPNQGQAYEAGTTQWISWIYSGSPGTSVKIELLKGGLLDSTITTGTTIGTGGWGSFPWTIPVEQASGADYRIRVTSTSNSAYADTGINTFTIVPMSINITVPNAGESWISGTTQRISWSYSGNPGSSVKIELLKGGVLNSIITASTPIGIYGSGSYTWTVPAGQASGNDYRIRITSTSNSAYMDTSDNDFSIVPPSITVNIPNDGDSWVAGTTQWIEWIYSGNPGSSVKIELLKGGALNSTIAASTPIGGNGWGSYSWAIPAGQTTGNDNRIRVTSTSNSAYVDTSDNDFVISIPDAIAVTSPNGGESWQAGTGRTISWTYTGNPGATVTIELLKGGVVNSTISASTPIGGDGWGSYSWAIPAGQTTGTDYRIRVTSTSNSAYVDTSDTDFAVVPPNITVSVPNNYEYWSAGTTQTISWSYSGNPGSSVKIELLKGGVFNSTITANAPVGISGSGSYAWTIPAGQASGTDYRIRVTSTSNGAVVDTSDTDFLIVPTSISVTAPNYYEYWSAGTTQIIGWTYSGDPGSSVKIELLKRGVLVRTIASSTPIGGYGGTSYYWAIPADLAAGLDYRIRVTSTADSAYADTSDNDFTVAAPAIDLINPNAGNTWPAGTTQTISWSYFGDPGPSVKIELLKGGVLDDTLAASVSIGTGGWGSYHWAIPMDQASGTDYRIRVTSTSNGTYTDTSLYDFTILPISIVLISPNGGEQWGAGTRATINWWYQGDPGSSVKIELLKGGAFYSTISSNATGSSYQGYYHWDIPTDLTPGIDYRIKLISNSSAAYSDTSNDNFTILPIAIALSSPNGGEILRAGTPTTISWTYTGDPGPSVAIELLKGGVVTNLIVARTPLGSGGNGSFTWLISSLQTPDSDYRIRITSATDSGYTVTSANNFTIQPY
jgi:YD repeat-containing protein